MRLQRLFVALATVAALVATAGPMWADALGELEKAHNAYVAHQYDNAEARLRVLLAPKNGTLKDPDSIADARMYLAAVLVAKGKADEANAVLEQLLLDKPDYQPDPLRVALDAIDALVDSRTRLRDRLAQMQVEAVRKEQEVRAKVDAERQTAALHLSMLEKFASEEVVVERNSRWLAFLPFGVGQFQNGQDGWGWFLLASESALALGSVIGGGVSYYDQLQATDAFERGSIDTARAYQIRAQQAAIAGDILAGGFAVAAVVGIVQAQLAFVPERTYVRKRDMPQLSIGPAGLGFAGAF